MNRSKRLFCALLACLIAGTAVCAEEAAEVTPSPTPAVVTPEPTAEPTVEPTVEPTEEPTVEPTAESSIEPTEEPTVEPTAEPGIEPTAEPTIEPTVEPTVEPTSEPTVEPTIEPTAKPTAAPDEMIEITVAENAQLVENIWQITGGMPDAQILFQWLPVESANVYEVRITDSLGAEILAVRTEEPQLPLPASTFGADTYLMTVSALLETQPEEGSGQQPEQTLLKQGEILFVLVQGSGEFPGGFPGGFPSGGRPGGSFGGGSMQAGAMPEEQGFRVTPGEALTSSHSSGSKNMQLYGTVDTSVQEESMTILTLDDVQLDITLDGQNGSFFAGCEEDTLILIPESEGSAWSISAFALKTLNRSGISHIRLVFGEEAHEISTQWNPQGSEYAHLCAEGYVSKDYTLTVTPTETLVTVADAVYTLNENNELVGG